jgi:hypothetical protein
MPRFPRLLLSIGGLLMLAAGAVGMTLGVTSASWLASLVPQVVIDNPAVGGAAVALGALVAVVGLTQLVLVVALRRQDPWVAAASSTVSGILAVLSLAVTAALATQTAAGGPMWLLLAAAGSLVIGVAYGVGAVRLAIRSA